MININGIPQEMIANNLTPYEPTHPGELLREELEERGLTQTQLAHYLDIQVSLLNELINGKRDFTIEYAMMIEAALGIDADFWINLQSNYNKTKAKKNKSFLTKLAAIRRVAAL